MFYRAVSLVSIVFFAFVTFAQEDSIFHRTAPLGYLPGLSGIVRNLDEKPVSGARIDVVDVSTGRTLATTYTFIDGSFEFPRLENGHYELITTSGVAESRSRIDLMSDRDIVVHLSNEHPDRPKGQTVSVSQMKVPGKARKIFNKAMEAFRKAHIDDAFSLVQKALGLYPDYAQALMLRGVLNMRKGDNQRAEPDLERAVELDNGDNLGPIALASLYNTEGRYEEADRLIKRVMVLHPNSWQAYMEMARAQIGMKNPDAALATLVKCERIVPPDVNLSYLLRAQAFLLKTNYPNAITQLETFLQKEPSGPNSETAQKLLSKVQMFVAQTSTGKPVGSK